MFPLGKPSVNLHISFIIYFKTKTKNHQRCEFICQRCTMHQLMCNTSQFVKHLKFRLQKISVIAGDLLKNQCEATHVSFLFGMCSMFLINTVWLQIFMVHLCRSCQMQIFLSTQACRVMVLLLHCNQHLESRYYSRMCALCTLFAGTNFYLNVLC